MSERPAIICEAFPVQYRAPVYRAVAHRSPGLLRVLYGNDLNLRGSFDEEFGQSFTWDAPLLEGYPCEVLSSGLRNGNATGTGRSSPALLMWRRLRELRPAHVVLTGFRHGSDWAALTAALSVGATLWLRVETSEEAFHRSRWRQWVRVLFYGRIYSLIERACYLGVANRNHLQRFGFSRSRLFRVPYSTPDWFAESNDPELRERRERWRTAHGYGPGDFVVGFFGKLIAKKDPGLLVDAWGCMTPATRARTRLLFVGAGELSDDLRESAERRRVPVEFAGFRNQSELPDFYLGVDAVVLPSRRLGETWGLVVNEALQAGCAVAASEAVGCVHEFRQLERFGVFPPGDAGALANVLESLQRWRRSFTWAREGIAEYRNDRVAERFADALKAAMESDRRRF